jgi:hypothetical protein
MTIVVRNVVAWLAGATATLVVLSIASTVLRLVFDRPRILAIQHAELLLISRESSIAT